MKLNAHLVTLTFDAIHIIAKHTTLAGRPFTHIPIALYIKVTGFEVHVRRRRITYFVS